MIHGDGSARPLAALVELAREAIAPEEIAQDALYIGLEDIAGESGAITTRTVDAGELKSGKFSFTNRHLLYGKLRPNLRKVARPNFSGICSTDILPLLPRDGVDRGFLFHWLRQPLVVAAVSSQATGVNLPRISPKRLLELQVPLPPLDTQRRIATLLDRADSVRCKREESRGLVDELLRSVFLEMFGDPVRNEKGWAVGCLSDVARIQGGLQLTPHRADLLLKVPYLRVANVHRGKLDLTEVKHFGVTPTEYERSQLRTNDVLMVEGHGNPGEVGRCAVWDGSIEGCLHQNHLINVRPDSMCLDSFYLAEFLNSAGGRRQLVRAGKTTSGLNTISTRQVKDLRVPLPPSELQSEFAKVVRAIRALASRLEAAGQTQYALAASCQDTLLAALG